MRRQLQLEHLEKRNLLTALTMVRYFDTWDAGVIRSTDVAGITFHPASGHLYLADSEISELPEFFVGDNIFATSLRGDQVFREIASNNHEPVGITYNQFDGYFYVVNDSTASVARYDHGLNNPLAEILTSDGVSSAEDPEGITSDPITGNLYVVDGKLGGRQVLVYNSNLEFLYRFSTAAEVTDGEGIGFDPV